MRKRNIYLLCAITFLQGMVFYAAVATLYRQAAGLSVFQITAIEGISVALSMALEIPWGWAADRLGYRRVMILCNALFLVTKVIFWQAESFLGFLTERLLLAVVISGLSGVDASMLYLSAPPRDAQRNSGWYFAAGEAGVLLSGLLYTAFLSGQYRQTALWTVVTYALAALLTLFLREVRPEEARTPREPLGRLVRAHFRVPGMLALVICAAVFSETVHCVTIYFNQLQYLRCGLPERAIGAAFLLASLAGFCGPLSARLTRRMGRRPMGIGLLLLSALCMGLLALTRSGPLSILLVTLLTALAALFSPLARVLENEKIATPDRATALSLNAMISDSLIVLLDIGLGRAADASLPLALGICGIACLGAAGLFRMVRVEPSLN